MKIDKRLQALYNEYYEKGKLASFVKMMYALIEMSGVLEKKENKTRLLFKSGYKRAIAYLESLTPTEWIKTLQEVHMPYDAWTKDTQGMFKHVVNHIETFDDKRMNGDVGAKERQKYPFGVQLFKVLLDKGFVTVDAAGTRPKYNMIAEFLNNYCKQWDLHETKNHRAQIVRFTGEDIQSYIVSLITAKRSRFTAIAKAFNVDEKVLSGYRDYIPGKAA